MFRRVIIQGTRQFASVSRSRGIPRTSPVALPSIRQWQVALPNARLRRGYSTEQTTNTSSEENKNGPTPDTSEPQPKTDQQASPKDTNESIKEAETLKQDLEERTKEVKDYKVSHLLSRSSETPNLTKNSLPLGQIPTCGGRLPQPAGPYGAREEDSQGLCHTKVR